MKCFKKEIPIQQTKKQLLHPFQTNDYTILKLHFTYINLMYQYHELATVNTFQITQNNFTFCMCAPAH
jgi:hypothetical protein